MIHALCPVCRRIEQGCTCVERQIIDLASTAATQREWEREGFRFVHYRPSATNEDELYCVYRCRADLYEPTEAHDG